MANDKQEVGLVLHPDYAEIAECDSCHTEDVGCKKFEAEAIMKSPERMLCYICAATFISQHQQYRHDADIAPVTQAIAQVANIVLKVFKGISLETSDEQEKADD